MKTVLKSFMIMNRCKWPGSDAQYIHYHDVEWGVPVYDDQKLFELLLLEGFQAGLSWLTILRKRSDFKKAFDNFDVQKVSKYDDKKLEELNHNRAIIRNKLKIKAAVTNAQAFIRIQEQFGSFSDYLWQFVGHKPIQNNWKNEADIPAKTELSEKISKDLKKHGFKFVGPTIVYAHMQSCGMVNDHVVDCFRHQEIKEIK